MGRILLNIIIIIILNSCQNSSRHIDSISKWQIDKNSLEICDVTIIGEFLKDDIIEVFYQDNAIHDYIHEYSLRKSIVGHPDVEQKFVFSIGEVKVEKIRIDIGQNPNNKVIVIKEVRIECQRGSILIDSSNFKEYFTANEYIKQGNNSTFYLQSKVKDGKESFDPYFISSPLLVKELVSL